MRGVDSSWVKVLACVLLIGSKHCWGWDTLTHLYLSRDTTAMAAAREKFEEAGFQAQAFSTDAFSAGVLAPDMFALLYSAELTGLAELKAVDPQELRGLLAGLVRVPSDKSLDKRVGIAYFHDYRYGDIGDFTGSAQSEWPASAGHTANFAAGLWIRALDATQHAPSLASFALGWTTHVACDAALDASAGDVGTDLNGKARLRAYLLGIVWADGELAGLVDPARGWAGSIPSQGSHIVGTYELCTPSWIEKNPDDGIQPKEMRGLTLPDLDRGRSHLQNLISGFSALGTYLGLWAPVLRRMPLWQAVPDATAERDTPLEEILQKYAGTSVTLSASYIGNLPVPQPRRGVEVITRPPGATVSVNGRGIADSVTPLSWWLPRDMGDPACVLVAVQLDGHQPQAREVRLAPGKLTRVEFDLTSVPSPRPPVNPGGGLASLLTLAVILFGIAVMFRPASLQRCLGSLVLLLLALLVAARVLMSISRHFAR